jgi:hypothetical protein
MPLGGGDAGHRLSLTIAPRNNPRPIPVLDRIPRIEPHGGLIGCAANDEVVGAGDDFVL